MKLETNNAVFGVWTLLWLIVYAWKMYDMQTLHAGGIPMFRGTYLVLYYFCYICSGFVYDSKVYYAPGTIVPMGAYCFYCVRMYVCMYVCMSEFG